MKVYPLIRPILFKLDAEQAHHVAVASARLAQRMGRSMVRGMLGYQHPALEQTLWGLPFRNPLSIAAGFDKNAVLTSFWEAAGCGYVEVGSVSAKPAEGNPKPRAFRLPTDHALINRMGLNNDGADVVARRLGKQIHQKTIPLGINLAKTHDPAILGDAAIEDFVYSFRTLAPLADYIALNISCPNTTEGKTFESPDALEALLKAIFAERTDMPSDVPVLIKFSPPATPHIQPGDAIDDLIAIARSYNVHGFIATNTASDRAGLKTSEQQLNAIGRGGLSGAPLRERATALIRYLYQATEGRIPIIGVGGIDGPEAAYEKIRAGASLLQVYTGLVYEGPGLIKRINQGLVRRLEQDGFNSISEAAGTSPVEIAASDEMASLPESPDTRALSRGSPQALPD